MKEFNISYVCVTDDKKPHGDVLDVKVEDSTQLTNIFSQIISELTEDGNEIVSLNMTVGHVV